MKINYENILGVNIVSSSYDKLTQSIDENIINKEQKIIVAANPEKYQLARKNSIINKALQYADYIIPDGSGIILASLLTGKNITRRITGVDLMKKLCELSNTNQYKIFLYGSKPDVLKATKNAIQLEYPNINIVGTVHGYTKNGDEIISAINESKPDIVFVALGSPKQEKWIFDNKDKIKATILQGVGGSFDIFSGSVKRAPLIFRRLSLEWLYRLIKNPSRAKRQLKLLDFIGASLSAGLSDNHNKSADNKQVDKSILWLNVFIIMQPLLYISTHYSVYARTAVHLIFLLYITTYIWRNLSLINRVLKILTTLSIIYFIIFITLNSYLLINFNAFATFIAFPLLIYLLIYTYILTLKKYDFKPTKRALLISALLYSGLIIIAQFSFNVIYSYSESGLGNSGWFYSANAIGNIFAITFPLVFIGLINSKGLLRKAYLATLVSLLISIVILGTKTPIISAVATTAVISIYKFRKYIITPIGLIITLLVILSATVILPNTPAYKNIGINKEISTALSAHNESESLLNNELLNIALNSRGHYLEDALSNSQESTTINKLFGEGYLCENNKCSIVEMDFFDLYFVGGIFGFTLTLSLLIYMLAYSWERIKNHLINAEPLILIYALALSFLLSFFSGHVLLTTPVYIFVIGYIGIIAGYASREEKS